MVSAIVPGVVPGAVIQMQVHSSGRPGWVVSGVDGDSDGLVSRCGPLGGQHGGCHRCERPPPEVAAAYSKTFPHLDGLIERWAEHVRRTEGSFPKFSPGTVTSTSRAAIAAMSRWSRQCPG